MRVRGVGEGEGLSVGKKKSKDPDWFPNVRVEP